jgi:hypothetical protein
MLHTSVAIGAYFELARELSRRDEGVILLSKEEKCGRMLHAPTLYFAQGSSLDIPLVLTNSIALFFWNIFVEGRKREHAIMLVPSRQKLAVVTSITSECSSYDSSTLL